jgi:hypothetical protein
MDVIAIIWSYLVSFPTIRFAVSVVVAFHHSTIGKYIEGWAVKKIDDLLPDGGPAETMVNNLYKEIKDM